MSFADLKKQSKLGSLTAKLVKEVEKMNNNGSTTGDDRIWKLECDKGGNGYAVIRFLPAPNGEDLPFVKLYSHAFQGPGGWYIENSLTTLNQKDPVSEYNTSLWNNGTDAGKETARKQKRKLTYVANIYVVKDPANPSNEGQVFLYKFGKKIFDKLTAAMQPEFEDEEAIWKKEYSLAELVAPDQFKSYDELKKRLDYVLGNTTTRRAAVDEELEDESEGRGSTRELTEDLRSELNSLKPTASVDDDDDDTLSYFAKLAE